MIYDLLILIALVLTALIFKKLLHKWIWILPASFICGILGLVLVNNGFSLSQNSNYYLEIFLAIIFATFPLTINKFDDSLFKKVKPQLLKDTKSITKNMEARGGGIVNIELINKTSKLNDYYQLHVSFETIDAMGANFINSCLEQIASSLEKHSVNIHIVMSILSNYVPDCLVRAEVSCKVENLVNNEEYSGQEFAEKFIQAVQIAEIEPFRAVTHNKGIMNGIDSVVLATGNDFRAVEAGVHAYAARSGSYSSLTHASIENGFFKFWIEIPLALGTVGGLTGLHPLVKTAMELLGNPSAKELMEIVAVAGLAQNFAAIKSLTTTGIQQGHMKMHLLNILNQFEATEKEKSYLIDYFKTNTVTHSAVVKAIEILRA